MKKRIKKTLYDTDTARFIGKYEDGAEGSDNYISESLYRMKNGQPFLYVKGGPETKYGAWKDGQRVSGEMIRPFSEEEANAWGAVHMSKEEYDAKMAEAVKRPKPRSFMLPASVDESLSSYCERTGAKKSHVIASAITEYVAAHDA